MAKPSDTIRPFTIAILTIPLTLALYGQTANDPHTWTPVTPPLTQARADACAVALPDGSAFVTGGVGINTGALSSVDKFQPSQGFAAGPAMNNVRAAHTCIALKDGRLLVVGGNDGHANPVGTAEIHDPATQAWAIVADLNAPRWGHTPTVLNNGRVLIARGAGRSRPERHTGTVRAESIGICARSGYAGCST